MIQLRNQGVNLENRGGRLWAPSPVLRGILSAQPWTRRSSLARRNTPSPSVGASRMMRRRCIALPPPICGSSFPSRPVSVITVCRWLISSKKAMSAFWKQAPGLNPPAKCVSQPMRHGGSAPRSKITFYGIGRLCAVAQAQHKKRSSLICVACARAWRMKRQRVKAISMCIRRLRMLLASPAPMSRRWKCASPLMTCH